jgi:enoyl-CoA hydratase/carnithine racemase
MGRIEFSVSNHVATILLDNPSKRNAVDAPMRAGLDQAYTEVRDNDDIRVAIIRGSGDLAFCSGGDIDGYNALGAFGPEGVGPPPIPRPWPIWKPFIAAIKGYAVGGGFALALACDLRVAGKGATIGPSGLRLTRLIGLSKALELLLLSRYVSGSEAASMGLVQSVVEDAAVFDAAQEWATTIAGYSPWAVSKTKQLAYEGLHLPFDEAFSREAAVAAEGYRRPDAVEAFTAFTVRKGPKP